MLLIEGVVDGYFPQPSVNALALAAHADALLPTVEDSLPRALALAGRRALPAPLSANLQVDAPSSPAREVFGPPP